MSSFQSDSESVRATYMSQAEANEVMELWTRRQREDAERQAMVTIHDVAEATQLSPQEIQRLLQDVRSSRHEVQAPRSNQNFAIVKHNSEAVHLALRVLPYTAIPAVGFLILCSYGPIVAANTAQLICVFWIFCLVISYAAVGFSRLRNDTKSGRAVRQSGSRLDQ